MFGIEIQKPPCVKCILLHKIIFIVGFRLRFLRVASQFDVSVRLCKIRIMGQRTEAVVHKYRFSNYVC